MSKVKERPILFRAEMVRAILDGKKTQTRRVIKPQPSDCEPAEIAYGCPYGQAGDQLWVRESYLPDPPNDGSWDYYAFTDGQHTNIKALPEEFRMPKHCIYAATWDSIELRWKPSIHMPRWASRIQLEIVNLRIQELQAISEDDAHAEGIPRRDGPYIWDFAKLWDQINAKRGYSWNSNPRVWVVEFKVVA